MQGWSYQIKCHKFIWLLECIRKNIASSNHCAQVNDKVKKSFVITRHNNVIVYISIRRYEIAAVNQHKVDFYYCQESGSSREADGEFHIGLVCPTDPPTHTTKKYAKKCFFSHTNIMWQNQFATLINIFWFYKPNQSKSLIYSTHLDWYCHRWIEFIFLFKPNSPCSFSFLGPTVPLFIFLEAFLWSDNFWLIIASSMMLSFLVYSQTTKNWAYNFPLQLGKFHPFVWVCISY